MSSSESRDASALPVSNERAEFCSGTLGVTLSPAMRSFLVCCFYGFTSGALALLNKSILSSYHFNGYMMILSAQMGLQLLLCVVTRDLMGNPFQVPLYDSATHQSSLRMGVSGVLNVVIGFVALQMVNVPMFLCIRRLVAPVILLYEFVVFGKRAEGSVQAAVGAILVGTLVAGYDSLQADIIGFSVTFLNNLFSAATSVMTKEFSVKQKLGALGTLYYNSMTAFPLALGLSVVMGEFYSLRHFHYTFDPGFWINFSICASMGPLITYSSILCTTYNSPLATSITGNVKDLGLTFIGALLFPGYKATASSVAGLLLSFFGAGLYSWVSLQAAMAKPAPALVENAAAAPKLESSAEDLGPSSPGDDEKDENARLVSQRRKKSTPLG